jgi:hypothetical protein
MLLSPHDNILSQSTIALHGFFSRRSRLLPANFFPFPGEGDTRKNKAEQGCLRLLRFVAAKVSVWPFPARAAPASNLNSPNHDKTRQHKPISAKLRRCKPVFKRQQSFMPQTTSLK